MLVFWGPHFVNHEEKQAVVFLELPVQALDTPYALLIGRADFTCILSTIKWLVMDTVHTVNTALPFDSSWERSQSQESLLKG